MPSSPRPSLKALTGVRFLAALHVVAFHYFPREGTPEWFQRLLECGPSSVTLFFILSGFILAYSYLGAGETVRVEPRAFWAARFARVYPVYVLGLVLMTPPLLDFLVRAAGGFTQEVLWKFSTTGAAVFSLTQAWAPPVACVWNCPGWSLSVEAFFYLLFPLLCVPVVRAGQRGLWASAAAMLGVTAAASVVWLLVDQWIAGSPAPLVGPEAWKQVAAYNPLLRLPQFLLGVVLGRLFSQRIHVGQGLGPAASSQALVAAGACLAIFVAPWAGPALAFKELALMPAFALLVWGLADGRGVLARVLEQPWAVRLGEASYALYILHPPMGFYVRLLDHRLGPGLAASSPRAFFAVYIALSLFVSLATFFWLEEPARRWLRARLSRRASVPAPFVSPT